MINELISSIFSFSHGCCEAQIEFRNFYNLEKFYIAPSIRSAVGSLPNVNFNYFFNIYIYKRISNYIFGTVYSKEDNVFKNRCHDLLLSV